MIKTILTGLIIVIGTIALNAQQIVKADFTSDAWEIIGAEKHAFQTFKGKESLYLENGRVRLKESRFKNGIIDFDIHFEPGRKFLGIHFRAKDSINYEEFYLRPHQSGNPDAMQYTPVFNGTAAWQLYHGPGYSNAYTYNFNEWIHIRLVISENRMDVFINDMSQPVLLGSPLKMDPVKGEIGFGTAMGGAHFANLAYRDQKNPALFAKSENEVEPEDTSVKKWMVSNAFNEKVLSDKNSLKYLGIKAQLRWIPLSSENSGIVNLSQISPVSETTNTVFAEVVLHSDKARIKRIDFGYSDMAKVFVNNKIVYSGQRKFRSRDYRYLGTIGYFDAIYAQLKKGKNEIVFAITENFGGWGLLAKLENLDGVTLKIDQSVALKE